MKETPLTADYNESARLLREALRADNSFDIITREVRFCNRKAGIFYVDGLCKEDMIEKITAALLAIKEAELEAIGDISAFARSFVTYAETKVCADTVRAAGAVLSGAVVLISQGIAGAVVIDIRQAPVRSVDEPQSDRVLRGPHDGFVESVVINAALIRRRIRDARLTMEQFNLGSESETDIVLCYMEGAADKKALDRLRKKLGSIKVKALTMSQQSLLECLVPKQFYNPFPKVRYTERPDCAAAAALEGRIIVITENSPVAMIVPTGVLDFLQDTNDYYLSPLVGSYIRIIRLVVMFLTLFLTPVWLMLVSDPQGIPARLEFVRIEEPNTVAPIVQLFIVEVVIDVLKLASINTPSALNSSFSVLGALVLGEFAVSSGWFVSEVVLYMAFVAITNFSQPSVEFGYAIKLMRMLILALTGLFSLWGFIAGTAVMLALIATTKTVTGSSYLYPLIPFNARALSRLIIRKPLKTEK